VGSKTIINDAQMDERGIDSVDSNAINLSGSCPKVLKDSTCLNTSTCLDEKAGEKVCEVDNENTDKETSEKADETTDENAGEKADEIAGGKADDIADEKVPLLRAPIIKEFTSNILSQTQTADFGADVKAEAGKRRSLRRRQTPKDVCTVYSPQAVLLEDLNTLRSTTSHCKQDVEPGRPKIHVASIVEEVETAHLLCSLIGAEQGLMLGV
jgi:hypothetical protein